MTGAFVTVTELPRDQSGLKRYLPSEPPSSCSELRAAIRRIDELITTTTGQLEQVDRDDRAAAGELVDAALNPNAPLEPLNRLDVAIRGGLQHRLDVLRTAYDVASRRLAKANLDDPIIQRWRAEVASITDEWRDILADPDEARRIDRLSDFANRHTQNPR